MGEICARGAWGDTLNLKVGIANLAHGSCLNLPEGKIVLNVKALQMIL